MQLRRCHRGADVLRTALIYVALMLALTWGGRNASAGLETPLLLEVFINGNPTNLIATFHSSATSELSATGTELRELGLKIPQDAAPSDIIFINQLPGVTYRYEPINQSLYLMVEASALMTNHFDGSRRRTSVGEAQVSPGLLLNYGLFGSLSSHTGRTDLPFNGASALLDARALSDIMTCESVLAS